MISSGTIAAISTPEAAGGIGIVRISGPDALAVANRIFRPVDGSSITDSKGYRAHFGMVASDGRDIDEAVCLVFRAPHSYTGEDTAEINCHGGLYVTKAVLRAAYAAGARPAEPGEFTKRAFLNGKKDLAGSEAVMALIGAKGEKAACAALNVLEGRLSAEINAVADSLTGVCAALSAWVDYPYDETEDTTVESMLAVFRSAKEKISRIINRYDCGKVYTEGIDTVICGKPNVGKSTLMNLLSGCERSIVTEIAGTTRDVVEESVSLGGMVLRIADTAGIHEAGDIVEGIGVDLARKRMERAGLVLAVFDSSLPLDENDMSILEACKGRDAIAVINKSDLEKRLDIFIIEKYIPVTAEISASNGTGADILEQKIAEMLCADGFDPDNPCLAGERQRECCVQALNYIDDGISALECGVTFDAVTVCAECAVGSLLELTGKRASDSVVERIFADFCVGK